MSDQNNADATLTELLALASEFTLATRDNGRPLITVRKVPGLDSERKPVIRWGVFRDGEPVGRDLSRVMEMTDRLPSARDEAFIANYRFNTREEAIEHGKRAVDAFEAAVTSEGLTFIVVERCWRDGGMTQDGTFQP
ncbi:hypothetical protein ACFOY8_14060 [Thalassospira xianhensis]|uniref:Uncharacterized protein n=1 Tax=Thalassospira xianhensis MCCC 1A02616 TaxID=1177929 RepID=A0A367UHD6_9PROT|nr:hypothetical protein [Thalassospira xianhensis]RCK07716.1 hypothetical protein TH5_01210 [Thalassospira xianhensis MCCC 1A02616]